MESLIKNKTNNLLFKTKLSISSVIVGMIIGIAPVLFAIYELKNRGSIELYIFIFSILFSYFIIQNLVKVFHIYVNSFVILYPLNLFRKKLIFDMNEILSITIKEVSGARGYSPKIIIFLKNKKEKKYSFSSPIADIQKMIDLLRKQGIQVNTIGEVWS